MRTGIGHVAAIGVLGAIMLTMASDQGSRAPVPAPGATAAGVPAPAATSAEDLVSRWPEKPRALARLMIETWGKPDEIVASQLSWSLRGPWSKIVVFRDPAPDGRGDHLLESVPYGAVLVDHHWRDLSAFGRGASYDPATHELTARTDSQETNYLALNLADEIARGRRNVRDAQSFYDTASRLSEAGKSSPYMNGLMFGPVVAPR